MPTDYQRLPHKGIQSLHPYIPGKSVAELANEQGLTDIIKLASNENPLGCSPKVREALAAMTGHEIAAYPAPAHHPVYKALSQHINLDENQITFSNGSDLLFTLLLNCFALHREKHMLTHEKAFMTYAIQAQTLGIPVKETPIKADWQVDIDAMIDACDENTAIIFLANPNNPTGRLIPLTEIQRLLSSIPDSVIMVVDEAYYEFAQSFSGGTAQTFLSQYPNLVVTRTFSKAYGLAGLRLGYAMANPAISSIMQRAQLPFMVNDAAMTAAQAALTDKAFIEESIRLNIEGLKQIGQGLQALNLSFHPSSCNFITFDCGIPAKPVYEALLRQGVIVRPLAPYGLPNHLRVSTGTQRQNTRFIDTLYQVWATEIKTDERFTAKAL